MVMGTVVIPLMMWERRGAAVAIVAFVVYGLGSLATALNYANVRAWSQRHVALDSLVIVPYTFLAFALITRLSLLLCLVIAVAVGLVFVPLGVRRGRKRRRERESF